MSRVFADSAFWIALRDSEDPRHEPARGVARWLMRNRRMLVVTPFIFAETQAYFSREPAMREMIIKDFWENAAVLVEQPNYNDQMEAIAILRRDRDKSYSFADTISFVVMKRMAISDVVTFDRHFRQFAEFRVIDQIPE